VPPVWFNGFWGSFAVNRSNNTDHKNMVGLPFLSGTPLSQDNDHGDASLDPPWAIRRWVGGLFGTARLNG